MVWNTSLILFHNLGTPAIPGWMFWFGHISRRRFKHAVVSLLGCSESCTAVTSDAHSLYCASYLLITHLFTGQGPR